MKKREGNLLDLYLDHICWGDAVHRQLIELPADILEDLGCLLMDNHGSNVPDEILPVGRHHILVFIERIPEKSRCESDSMRNCR